MFWLQKIVYVYLNTIARIALRIYFRKITINGKNSIPKNCPTLIAPNHPNTMVDPVLMAGIVPGWIHFLANYGLFKHPITHFLMTKIFFSIPVKREKDLKQGETINNLATIKLCSKVLAQKGTIFMGPEATSYSYRRIRPLKDGIARIALTAAKSQKFKSGLIILPMGTNYSEPSLFRSEIIANVGEPIFLDQYKDEYKKDKAATAQKIMTILRDSLESLSIHTDDEVEAQFLEWVETMGKSEGKYQTFEERLVYAREIVPLIQNMRLREYPLFESLWRDFYTYFQSLEKIRSNDISVKTNKAPSLFHLIIIVLYAPIHLLANILNFQWNFPEMLFIQLKLYKSYATMVKLLGGVVGIPLFTSLVFIIISWFWNIKYALIYLLVCFLLGILILPFRRLKSKYFKQKNFYHHPEKKQFIRERDSLVRKLKDSKLL